MLNYLINYRIISSRLTSLISTYNFADTKLLTIPYKSNHSLTLMVLSRRPLTIFWSSYCRQYTPLLASLRHWIRCILHCPVRQLSSICYTAFLIHHRLVIVSQRARIIIILSFFVYILTAFFPVG